MTEEQTTKSIIRFLVRKGWDIIAFDFPQSGTGRCLHPNNTDSKTEGIWIPDIIAYKNKNLVFFENKDRFVLNDFEKVDYLKRTNSYKDAIAIITQGYTCKNIYYGIGFPNKEIEIEKANHYLSLIDFIVLAIDKDNAKVYYDPSNMF